jgi:hypothetical protein
MPVTPSVLEESLLSQKKWNLLHAASVVLYPFSTQAQFSIHPANLMQILTFRTCRCVRANSCIQTPTVAASTFHIPDTHKGAESQMCSLNPAHCIFLYARDSGDALKPLSSLSVA